MKEARFLSLQFLSVCRIAEEFHLLQSGGSDFHGDNKVNIHLGWGKGNLKIPMRFYEDISKASPASEVEV